MYIGYDLQTAVPGYLIIDDISSGFNGSATSFALLVGGVKPTPMPASPQQVLISVNGVVQEPDPTGSAGFTVTGDNIVFSSAPTNGHAFFGIVLAGADYANAGGEFPDGTIAAPSFTFANDNDTGWFREGSGSVGFSANGSQILNYDGNGLNFVDSKKLQLGAGNDLQIYHDGSHSYIADSGTGDLNILASKVQILNPANSETMAIFREDGAIDLYHNNVKKFETTSGGISVTGGINLTTNLSLLDDGIAKFGTGDDLQIYSDGSDSFFKSQTGNIDIRSTNAGSINLRADDKYGIYIQNSGTVRLYHNDTAHFETAAGGVVVTGIHSVGTGATISGTGNAAFAGVCTASSFVGDGSALTGLSAGGGGSGDFNTGISSAKQYDVTNSMATAYTASSSSDYRTIVHSIHICNISGSEVTISGEMQTDFSFAHTIPVPAGSAVELLKQPKVLGPSETIELQASSGSSLEATIITELKEDTAYWDAQIALSSADTMTDLYTSTSNPSVVQSILLCNNDGTNDVKAKVVWTDEGDNIQSYLVFDMIIPADSTVEICETPKYLNTGYKLRASANQANRLEITASGKQITS